MSQADPLEQFNSRIPADLHRRVKLFCVASDVQIQDFTREAFEEKLARSISTPAKKVVPFDRKAGNRSRRRQ